MPRRRYALTRGEPKRVEVSSRFFRSDLTIRFDGNIIGTIPTRQELKAGREFSLGDGSVLQVQLVQNFLNTHLRVLRNGQPLPGSPSDPFQILKTTYGVIFFIGGLNIVEGIVLALVQNLPSTLQGSSIGALISGLVFVLLGFFVRRRSAIALGIAVALQALNVLVWDFLGWAWVSSGSLGGGIVGLQIGLLFFMIRGFSAIREIRNTAVINQFQG